jgi:asparagine synthase (glutamine-hydrolysing)
MCGIAGWIATGLGIPTGATCEGMLDTLGHRGPDDRGVFRRGYSANGYEVFLGHTRLAIIDPQGAAQPMCDPDAGLALTFNGEIYNFRELRATLRRAGFRFVLDSDTEVLLRAYQYWRGDVVHRLRGMFAFAIWDARDQSLFLARDRFGEKPLFLHERGASLYFASEIKSLLRVPGIQRTVNLESVWEYLAYRYVPGPATLFAGIRKLPPATTALWRRGALVETRYWAPPDRDAYSPPPSQADAVGGFSRRLEEAVKLQMVADAPLGAFLSGGIDSSVIVALMSRQGARVRTFSVGFGESRYSELPFAAEVASHLATDHHELVVSHADVMNRLEPLVAMRDAPVSEPSDIALHMLAREAARGVKTVLTGEGGDEVLGGYPKHTAERAVPGFQRLPSWLRRGLIEPLVHALPYGCGRIKTAVTSLNLHDRRERYARWFGALSDRQRERLTSFRGAAKESLDRPPFDADPRASALRRILYFDQTSWLPDNLLERADRMTMAASIEARVPFLDHELTAYVSALPDCYRVKGFTGKWVLREAAKQWLPRRVLTRPKVGFRLPVNEWFRGPMRDYLLDHLRSGESLTRDYYDPQALDALLDEHLAGRQNHEKLLWTLLNLEVWHRHHGLPLARAPATANLRCVA